MLHPRLGDSLHDVIEWLPLLPLFFGVVRSTIILQQPKLHTLSNPEPEVAVEVMGVTATLRMETAISLVVSWVISQVIKLHINSGDGSGEANEIGMVRKIKVEVELMEGTEEVIVLEATAKIDMELCLT